MLAARQGFLSLALVTNYRRSPVLLIMQPFFISAAILGYQGAKHCKELYVAAHFMGSAGLALVFLFFILAETFLKHAQHQEHANADLFSDNWGKGTIIKGNSTFEHKRMAKINFHMSMNHKDRALYHAYRDIDEACHTLPECVRKDAKHMYKKFNEEKLTRGAVRLGIKANCVLYACRLAKHPRTTKEIADMFGIQSRDISRTTQMFKENIEGDTKKNYVTKSFDVLQRLLNNFEVTKEERLECIKLCDKTEDCVHLMSKNPNSVASAIIYIVIGHRVPKHETCEKCSVSVPTLNKIETLARKHLNIL